MKKRITLRIFLIGCLHTVLYLYIVPFIIYPKFGKHGIMFAVTLAIIISAVVLGTLFLEKKNKGDKNGRY
ncbi:MAG: hypothetical protein A2277_16180 [Desulfobacterales bacterium RIFOXYA12_FULL_46_15]|nr:MAG: hypothetical protein A2097_09320 [Desulfobacula sp. GWF2_41_7]OGR25620.1 MAG: hypothetical protein A2277_16180 [Desulfobacterales bacterium RIFOXYA12_FULL_46_15]